jgi:hypothetical protein
LKVTRHAGVAVEAGAEIFGKITAVLARVIEHDFVEAAIATAAFEFVELDGKTRFILKGPKAAFAFEAHAAVVERLIFGGDGGADVSLLAAPELVECGLGDVDFEVANGGVGKQFVASRGRVSPGCRKRQKQTPG